MPCSGSRGSGNTVKAVLPFVDIFGFRVPTYGTLGVIGWLTGLAYVLLCCKKRNISRENAAYLFTLGMIACVGGAKLLYLLVSIPQIIGDFGAGIYTAGELLHKYVSGGMVFYGGIAGAIAGARLAAGYFEIDIEDYYPVLVPAIAIVAAFGRLGCYATGCCYGCEYSGPFSVVFTEPFIAPVGVRLFPTQLAEAFFDILLFAVLHILSGRGVRGKRLVWYFLVLYAPFRFGLEFFRGDSERGMLFGLSTSQWISLILLAGCAVYKRKYRKKAR